MASNPKPMFTWFPYPFIRICLFLIAGLLLGHYLPHAAKVPAWLWLLFLTCPLLYFRFRNQLPALFSGLFVFPFFVLLGFQLSQNALPQNQDGHIIHFQDSIQAFQARVVAWPERRPKNIRTVVEVERVLLNGSWQNAQGKVQVFFPLSLPDSVKVEYGESFLFKGKPQPIDGPYNPDEFDYARFMALQGVNFRFFAQNNFRYLNQQKANPFLAFSYRLRSHYHKKFERLITGPQEQAIVLALVLGIKEGLDHELKEAFSSAGAMHVLAVSGLHVGMIYLVLGRILSFLLAKGFAGRLTFAGTNLLALWLYALLTGSPASVIRAATMFSVVVIAKAANRKGHIFNSLALAAFIMLVYDPLLLFTVGFQLSFLAVFGIVYLFPQLKFLYLPPNTFSLKVWELLCVSMAAQLATFPLGIYYFHRFPNYFLLSNLFVIPAAFVILSLGLGIMTIGFWEPAARLFAFVLEHFTRVLNGLIFWVDGLPFSSVDDLKIRFTSLLLLAAFIWCLAYTYQNKKASAFYFSCFLGGFLAFSLAPQSRSGLGEHLVLYRIPGYTCVEAYQDSFYQSLFPGNQSPPPQTINFHVGGHRLVSKAKQEGEWLAFDSETGLLIWNGLRVLFLNQSTNINLKTKNLAYFDYLVITENAIETIDSLPMGLLFDNLVLDSSCTFYQAQKLKKQALAKGLNVHSLWEDGALIIKAKKAYGSGNI